MRLSVDYRFQREGEDVTESCLEPHSSPRLTWDEVYDGWTRQDLEYYWRTKLYTVVPWDPTFHELPSDHLKEAIQERISWRPEELDAVVEAIRQNPEDLKLVQERMRDRARQRVERQGSRTPDSSAEPREG
jgi:hypothetical protein